MTDTKPRCQYWDKCYRKNATHLSQFLHPRDLDKGGKLKATKGANKAKAKAKKADEGATTSTTIINGDAKAQTMDETEENSNVSAAPSHAAAAPSIQTSKKRKDPTPSHSSPSSSVTNTGSGASAAAAVATATATATASSNSASESASAPPAEAVFPLEDVDLSAETLKLWQSFHDGCWSVSCPVHSFASPPPSFFPLASRLLSALYSMPWPDDLYRTFMLAAEIQNQTATRPADRCDIGDYQNAEQKRTEDGEEKKEGTHGAEAQQNSDVDALCAAASTGTAETPSSSSSSCSWHSYCRSLLHVFRSAIGLDLAGTFRILCGEFRHANPAKLHTFLLDRFFYDSPEVQTVLKAAASSTSSASASSSSPSSHSCRPADYHVAYYRDEPVLDSPSFVGTLTSNSPVVTPIAPNLLAALWHLADEAAADSGSGGGGGKKQKSAAASSPATAIQPTLPGSPFNAVQLRSHLTSFASRLGLPSVSTKGGRQRWAGREWIRRQKRVVCELDNKVGLVVPYEDDIGWRPAESESDEVDKIVKAIDTARATGKKANFDELDSLITLTQYANDERDPGMGIELGLKLFAKAKTNAVNSDVCRLLGLGYSLISGREVYGRVAEEHMKHRQREGPAKHMEE